MMMRAILCCYFLICSTLHTYAQFHTELMRYKPPVSIADSALIDDFLIRRIIIDSVVQTGPIPDIPAAEIFNNVIMMYGCHDPSAPPTTIVVTTRTFIRNQYWRFFSTRSKAFRKHVPAPDKFNHFTYYINGVIICQSLEEELNKITKKNFISLHIDQDGIKIKLKQS